MLFRAMRGPLIHRVARLPHVKLIARRLCSSSKADAKEATEAVAKKAWWQTAEFWGAAGAIAGWGMTGAAIYDASMAGPEVISMKMTGIFMTGAACPQRLS